MRAAIFASAISAIAAIPAQAEERTTLPEIVVGATAPTHAVNERCVDVRIGDAQSFGCLNQKLKRQVDQVNPVPNVAPIDAKSQDIKVGVVNVPGVQQQYGRNFGVSVYPYRPSASVYSSPLGRR
jgi:hypothetical protein